MVRRLGFTCATALRRIRRGIVALLCVVLVLCTADLSFGGKKKQPFDVSGRSWTLAMRGRVVTTSRGRRPIRRPTVSVRTRVQFHADGTLTLVLDDATYYGTWTQSGKRVSIEMERLLRQDLDAECEIPGCKTKLSVKASASVKKGAERLKLRYRYSYRYRAIGRFWRSMWTYTGKSESEGPL
jgi:hypothetical protein